MLSNFRKTFKPTPDEKMEALEFLNKLRQEQIGHCSTCAHYTSSTMPGFVEDYGECKVNSPIFAEKVCQEYSLGLSCTYYLERRIDIL